MTDQLIVEYHAEPHLPADALAILDVKPGRIDVYLSEAHTLTEVVAHLNPLLATYREAYGVHQTLSLVG